MKIMTWPVLISIYFLSFQAFLTHPLNLETTLTPNSTELIRNKTFIVILNKTLSIINKLDMFVLEVRNIILSSRNEIINIFKNDDHMQHRLFSLIQNQHSLKHKLEISSGHLQKVLNQSSGLLKHITERGYIPEDSNQVGE